VIAAADLAASVDDWQRWLRHERRASAHTLAAYRRDLASFLMFLSGHLGRAACLADLAALTRADFRAWLTARGAIDLQASSDRARLQRR
jgi:integrase/recombinase XerC